LPRLIRKRPVRNNGPFLFFDSIVDLPR